MTKVAGLNTTDAAALRDFVDKVRAALGPNLIALKLFGSKATGAAAPDSDIDVFVLVGEANSRLEDRIVDLAFDVNLEHNVYISPFVVTQAIIDHPVWSILPVFRAIDRHGVLL